MHSGSMERRKYADGFAEYGSFYGGPSFDYLAPAKAATSSIQELPSEHVNRSIHETAAHFSTIKSSNIAAHSSNVEAEGLQFTPAHGLFRFAPAHTQGLELDVRYQQINMLQEKPIARPAPLNYSRNAPRAQPRMRMHHFLSAPASPDLQQGHHQQTNLPLQPQPLQIPRMSSAMPSTPPTSYGSSFSNEDLFPERLQSLHISGQYTQALKQAESPTSAPYGLAHTSTTSSMSSGLSSIHTPSRGQSITDSSCTKQQRVSINLSTPASQDSHMSDMTSSDTETEIRRRLSSREGISDRKVTVGPPSKMGSSLKRVNANSKNAGEISQGALTDLLEEVASEGSLSLVKAVLAMGADPVYRSNGKLKKVKHEALSKATLNGRARVVDHLLQEGATYGDLAKRETYTPTDRALLATAYRGHADLVNCLICSHGANPMTEQWPREMYDTQHYWADSQVRLAQSSVLDAISKWTDVDQGTNTLEIIMRSPKFDPTALVAGVFDTKSELQTAEFGHRPWQTTYEYSALSCYVRAGWADVVEDMLEMRGAPKDYEREDDVMQYQSKVTRYISPVSALTRDTWKERPEEALRILKLLVDREFSIELVQRTATDMGQRTALGRAISADAAQGVELILQTKPSLVREDISFRRLKKETKALPLAAALSLDSLETARVLLRAGAHPRDPALDNMNNLQFAAHQGGTTGTAMLKEMIGLAPELIYEALDLAITRFHKDAVSVLLDAITAAALRQELAVLPPIYDTLLHCTDTDKDEETKKNHQDLIDMVIQWDAGFALQRPQPPAIFSAIRKDNYVGMEKLLKVGVIDGKTLALNSRSHLPGEQGLWTMLECCEMTKRSADWLGLLRCYGAPLY